MNSHGQFADTTIGFYISLRMAVYSLISHPKNFFIFSTKITLGGLQLHFCGNNRSCNLEFTQGPAHNGLVFMKDTLGAPRSIKTELLTIMMQPTVLIISVFHSVFKKIFILQSIFPSSGKLHATRLPNKRSRTDRQISYFTAGCYYNQSRLTSSYGQF